MYVCMYIYIYVERGGECVCVSERERETESARERACARARERDRERERESWGGGPKQNLFTAVAKQNLLSAVAKKPSFWGETKAVDSCCKKALLADVFTASTKETYYRGKRDAL
jgi:hypothetical protein